eukprot:GHVT01081402.1.p1 GENE.GHVT01081402.1~~GHVT01081402.1.p1  ORF type:complete len:493 (+),score=44.55 GHVT01081402.1:194-1672(+)
MRVTVELLIVGGGLLISVFATAMFNPLELFFDQNDTAALLPGRRLGVAEDMIKKLCEQRLKQNRETLGHPTIIRKDSSSTNVVLKSKNTIHGGPQKNITGNSGKNSKAAKSKGNGPFIIGIPHLKPIPSKTPGKNIPNVRATPASGKTRQDLNKAYNEKVMHIDSNSSGPSNRKQPPPRPPVGLVTTRPHLGEEYWQENVQHDPKTFSRSGALVTLSFIVYGKNGIPKGSGGGVRRQTRRGDKSWGGPAPQAGMRNFALGFGLVTDAQREKLKKARRSEIFQDMAKAKKPPPAPPRTKREVIKGPMKNDPVSRDLVSGLRGVFNKRRLANSTTIGSVDEATFEEATDLENTTTPASLKRSGPAIPYHLDYSAKEIVVECPENRIIRMPFKSIKLAMSAAPASGPAELPSRGVSPPLTSFGRSSIATIPWYIPVALGTAVACHLGLKIVRTVMPVPSLKPKQQKTNPAAINPEEDQVENNTHGVTPCFAQRSP